MPIVTLSNLSLAFGTDQIFNQAEFSLEAGERVALAGRNGAGKSTLLGLVNGEVQEDDGSIWRADNLVFAALPQSLPDRTTDTVFDVVAAVFERTGRLLKEYHQLTLNASPGDTDSRRMSELQSELDHLEGWNLNHRIDATLDRLGLDPEARLESLSGGWLKRVAIAQSLVLEPDVWLLDEPTNHLDIEGIEWLEQLLLGFPGTVLFVSHDRTLMQSVATAVVEIDRGRITRYNCDYRTFIDRRDKAREDEANQDRLFDDKLKQEEAWIRQGIKARRTRNEGRVRALEALREERKERITRGSLNLQVDSGSDSGKIVKEVSSLGHSIGGQVIVQGLDLIIQRGDRIGLLGPNGCGKSTLLKLLLEDLKPDAGDVRTGTRLQLAYFDQAREQLSPDMSVRDYIAEGREFITIQGREVHVVSYLQNFLFNPDQSAAPIRTLSGGEQNRLLLAKLFTQPANLLVLDEPTNDLDIETLELLEELLIDYEGTVLLVSHDRQFMDNVVSSLLVFEGDGKVQEYVGGYADWASDRRAVRVELPSARQAAKRADDHESRKRQKAAEQKRLRDLDKLTSKIDETEKALTELNEKMADPGFFELADSEQQAHYDKARAMEDSIESLMTEWETLEAAQSQD